MSVKDLNDEQLAAVKHPPGTPMCLIAGAGSGKTRVIQHRVEWLINEGVPPRKILVVTFTNKASAEISRRILENVSVPEGQNPRVTTIHSLALAAIRRNPKGFGLQERVSLLDDYDQGMLMRKVIDREIKEDKRDDYNPWGVLEKIAYHRARGVGFSVDYTEEVHKKAEHSHSGYHALNEPERMLWKQYELEKTNTSTLDFDDMLHLVVRRVRDDKSWATAFSKVFQFVLMDEAQDTNPVQWNLVNSLLSQDNLNLCAVGDISQCQPAGTKVRIVQKPPRGSFPGSTLEKNIEEIQDGELATVWVKHDQYTYNSGRKIRTAKRWYKGPMLSVSTDGKTTRVTPNHWLWVRFNKQCEGKYFVYLMYREDLGYRVGITKIKKGSSLASYGLSYRMAQEKADKAWVLRVCKTRAEAECWEEIISVTYGIPECVFEAEGCLNRTSELIRLVFSSVSRSGGERCLSDYHLLKEFPIATRNGKMVKGHRVYNQSWRGYFKTAAANLISGIMEIPRERANFSTPITSITSEDFEGWVYSLDVEKDHTYIADGIIVGNSIYGFNGSAPEILKCYSESWRGVVPSLYRLEKNYRSVPEVVFLANKIQQNMVMTIPLSMTSDRGERGHRGQIRLLKIEEKPGQPEVDPTPKGIAQHIAQQIWRDKDKIPYKENAILVRSGKSQVRDIEAELVRLRIPYVIRGGQGLLQTEEVRDIISYLKLATNPKDFMALNRCVAVPRRGIGTVALEKIRAVANQKHQGDLLASAWEIMNEKLGGFVNLIRHIASSKDPNEAVDRAIKLTRYRDYLQDKYGKKDRDKLVVKLENLERFAIVVAGLLDTSEMTLEDLVFQLSMDDQAKEGDDTGKVVVSTIHKAKGLEWCRVFITNCYEGSLPHQYSMGSPEEVDEERRLWYVAVTRAKDISVVCVPTRINKRTNQGWVRTPVQQSRFLTEIGLL